MGVLDEPLADVCSTLSEVFVDATASIIRRSDSGYNPETGGNTSPVAPETFTGVKIMPPKAYRIDQVDGSSIQKGDLQIDVVEDSLTIVPDPSTDKLVVNGETFNIIASNPLYSGDSVCLYQLQCRR